MQIRRYIGPPFTGYVILKKRPWIERQFKIKEQTLIMGEVSINWSGKEQFKFIPLLPLLKGEIPFSNIMKRKNPTREFIYISIERTDRRITPEDVRLS